MVSAQCGRMMLAVVIYALMVAVLDIQAQTNYRKVCYFTNWSRWRQGIGKFGPEHVDPFLCTHIVFAFGTFDASGNVTPFEPGKDENDYLTLNEKKQENRNLKLLLAFGGWNFGSVAFSNMVASPALRATFIRNVVRFMRTHGFDGLDIDWEYPAARGGQVADKQNLVTLCMELAEAFTVDSRQSGLPRFLLTAAVPASPQTASNGYDVPALSRYFDFINLMSYDFHGGWDHKTGFNSPLFGSPSDDNPEFNMDSAARWWNENGMPKNKITIGMATYGRSFTLSNPSNNVVGAAAATGPAGPVTRSQGFWSYYEICQEINRGAGRVVFDDVQKVPYYVKDTLWIGFDNEQSLRIKAEWLKSNNYGGVMFWALDLDDFNMVCTPTSTRKYPLIKTVTDILDNGQVTQSAPTTSLLTSARISTTSSDMTTRSSAAPTTAPATTSGSVSPAPTNYRKVCYFTNWSRWRQGIGKFGPENVDPFLCTHIVFAFGTFDASGNVTPFEPGKDENDYVTLNEKKQENRNLKLLLAFGGWNFGSVAFSNMVASPALRATFIRNVVMFMRTHGFDGLDIDWEYPAARGGQVADKQNLVTLCMELAEAFTVDSRQSGLPRFLLTAAVPASPQTASNGYDVPALSRYFDFINLMSYDFHGGWDHKTGFNSPLFGSPSDDNPEFNMDSAARWWNENGMPKNKITIGMATYGRSFTLSNPSNNVVGAAAATGPAGPVTRSQGFWSYYEICQEINRGAGRVVFDDVQKVPYYVKDTLWIGFDNEQSLRIKAEWLKSNNYGGVMFWALDLDDFNMVCTPTSTRKYPLIKTVTDILDNGQVTQSAPTTRNHQTSTISVLTSSRTSTRSTRPSTRPTTIAATTAKCATSGPASPEPFTCRGKAVGMYPDPANCNKYYWCLSWGQFSMPCGATLVWDTRYKTCNYADSFNTAHCVYERN